MIIDVIFAVDILKKFKTIPVRCETFVYIEVIDCFIDMRNKAIRILYFLNVVGKYLEHDFDYLTFARAIFFINPIALFPKNDCIGEGRYIIFSDFV